MDWTHCISHDCFTAHGSTDAAAHTRTLRWLCLHRFEGQVWQADYGYSGGATYSFATHIKGTPDPALFASERYNSGTSPLVYSFSVANGSYHVNLLFAENYSSLESVGARVFNVKIQGNPVFQNLDIFAAAGARTALLKGADVTVSNGILSIEFENLVPNAKVDGIEILPASSGPLLTLNFKYPDGTPVVGTLAYTISSSPLNFQGSVPLANGQAECLLFANPSSLGISAQYTVKLSLTDSASHLLWQLNLGMNPAEVKLAAVQNSSLNVTVQKL